MLKIKWNVTKWTRSMQTTLPRSIFILDKMMVLVCLKMSTINFVVDVVSNEHCLKGSKAIEVLLKGEWELRKRWFVAQDFTICLTITMMFLKESLGTYNNVVISSKNQGEMNIENIVVKFTFGIYPLNSSQSNDYWLLVKVYN